MAAYGLYSHIRANRVRSVFLIAGLFFLVYLLAFAGSLIAAVITEGDAPLDYLLQVAREEFPSRNSDRHDRHADLALDCLAIPPAHDRCDG